VAQPLYSQPNQWVIVRTVVGVHQEALAKDGLERRQIFAFT
jgi:hypothetical protein